MASAEAHNEKEYPDRDVLRAAITRFDAATQAVAVGAIVEGKGDSDLAEALGVSRRTVARKLSRFLQIARQQLAGALAAATLAGCVGDLPGPESQGALLQIAAEPVAAETRHQSLSGLPLTIPSAHANGRSREEGARAAPEQAHHVTHAQAGAIHAHVVRQMATHLSEVREKVAETILAESRNVGIDPLLLLADIKIESAFDPGAVSRAGATGLMQLMRPTMRKELVRSNLPAADPRDPVANVQAGVRYLGRLIDAFGDTNLALMAYNAGPSRIRRCLRQGEIPESLRSYPRKVNGEIARLRSDLEATVQSASAAYPETFNRML